MNRSTSSASIAPGPDSTSIPIDGSINSELPLTGNLVDGDSKDEAIVNDDSLDDSANTARGEWKLKRLPTHRQPELKLTGQDSKPGVVPPPDNWWLTLVMWEGSVLQSIYFRVAVVITFNIILCALNQGGIKIPVFSPIPHTLVGLPLGLLLVFRTNSAYDRFWEGRKAWGTIVINARNFARLLATTTPMHRTLDRINNLYLAFACSLKHRLRGTHNTEEEIEELSDLLVPETFETVMKVNNRPAAVLRLISEFVRDKSTCGEMSEFMLPYLEDLINQCMTSQTACERIINTPMPLPYLIQIRQLVFLYVITLPLIMIGLFNNWASLAGSFLLSFGLLGIEEAGKIIENPFGTDDSDLPLERYCTVMETDLRQISAFSRMSYQITRFSRVQSANPANRGMTIAPSLVMQAAQQQNTPVSPASRIPPADGRFRFEKLSELDLDGVVDTSAAEVDSQLGTARNSARASARKNSKMNSVSQYLTSAGVISGSKALDLDVNAMDPELRKKVERVGNIASGNDLMPAMGFSQKQVLHNTNRYMDENEEDGADPSGVHGFETKPVINKLPLKSP